MRLVAIKLLIVDDHRLVREGIKRILSDTSDIIVVSEADDGENAIKQAIIHNPDIIQIGRASCRERV